MKANIRKESHVKPTKVAGGDWHVSHTSLGAGTYYGQGVKNPGGKVIEGMGTNPMSKKRLGKAPTKLA